LLNHSRLHYYHSLLPHYSWDSIQRTNIFTTYIMSSWLLYPKFNDSLCINGDQRVDSKSVLTIVYNTQNHWVPVLFPEVRSLHLSVCPYTWCNSWVTANFHEIWYRVWEKVQINPNFRKHLKKITSNLHAEKQSFLGYL
jgi:hypothetical protein